jgi:hypothetical protein
MGKARGQLLSLNISFQDGTRIIHFISLRDKLHRPLGGDSNVTPSSLASD